MKRWPVPFAAGLLVALSAAPALPKVGTVGLAWFAGHYARVGTDGADPPAAIDDVVRIDYRGQWIEFTDCAGKVTQLTNDPAFDYADHLIGLNDGVAVDCKYIVGAGKRPELTCNAKDGAAFTLMSIPEDEGKAKAACTP